MSGRASAIACVVSDVLFSIAFNRLTVSESDPTSVLLFATSVRMNACVCAGSISPNCDRRIVSFVSSSTSLTPLPIWANDAATSRVPSCAVPSSSISVRDNSLILSIAVSTGILSMLSLYTLRNLTNWSSTFMNSLAAAAPAIANGTEKPTVIWRPAHCMFLPVSTIVLPNACSNVLFSAILCRRLVCALLKSSMTSTPRFIPVIMSFCATNCAEYRAA